MGRAKIIPDKDALLLPYQRRWVLDKSRIKIMEKSRQIGISWASAYGLVRRKSLTGAALDGWVSSRDEIQARLFLDDCKHFAELLHMVAEDLGAQLLDDKGSTSFVLRFASGVKINSMSSSPDAQAGKRGDRLLDEFALHKDNRKLYAIAYPGITWGGQLEMVSTHRGSHNFFNQLIVEAREKGNPKKVSLHRVTLEDALNDGFLYRLQEKLSPEDERQEMDEADYYNFIRSGCADEESFLQEYMCVPADDASAFLTYDQIAACEYEREPAHLTDTDDLTDLASAGPLYIGVDVGREHDLTVIWVNSFEGERHLCRRLICLQGVSFTRQEEILYPFLALPNLRRCCIDASGLGMQLAERAADRYGKYRVEGIKFSGPVKEELAYPFRTCFEDLNIRIPHDPKLRSDLRAIKKETTAAGNIRFSADRGENGHSDRFWAGALAVHARGKGNGPCKFESCGSRTADEGIKDNFYNPKRVIEHEISNWPC
ncbi:MAG: terminase family protein [Victivallales bacterium]